SHAGFGQSTIVTGDAFHEERRCLVLLRETLRLGTATITPSSGARPRGPAGTLNRLTGSASPIGDRSPHHGYGPGRRPAVRRIPRTGPDNPDRTPGSAAA